jgi:alpha 1,2-mannosyltransferase
VQIGLHLLSGLLYRENGSSISFLRFASGGERTDVYGTSANPGDYTPRANATFVILARNSEIEGAVNAIRALEDRFNRRHHYPYVYLNDEEFSPDFKTYMQ